MRLSKIDITNFRGLQHVTLPASNRVTVIVGPNAIGKTTIFEAVRLAKVTLIQRINGETQNALVNMGIASAQTGTVGGPGSEFLNLANDPTQAVRLSCEFELSQQDYDKLVASVEVLALLALQMRNISPDQDQFAFTNYLSTEEGQKALATERDASIRALEKLGAGSRITLGLQIDPVSKQMRGTSPEAQRYLTVLDRSLPPFKTYFNYFPADRALPAGEVAIQLGSADAQQQLLSYFAHPALKFARIKQTVISQILFDEAGRQILANEFNRIFDELLPNKTLQGIHFNEFGTLRVLVRDRKSDKVFDIDSMSSGEKGLILTFLLMQLNSEPGAVLLLDEPELHLNSAVCSKILPFLIEAAERLNVQILVCTHSPEIVRDAFERDDCSLFHLRSASDLTPVLRQDNGEVFEILSRLGNAPADVLFSRGNVFVEGEHDAAILSAGFGPRLVGYKLTSLGGRAEIEKEIPNLQEQDKAGKLDKTQLFLFDGDGRPAKFKSTQRVRVTQLKKYCIENYLLDQVVLYDLLSAHAKHFNVSRGEFPNKLEEIALRQMNGAIISKVYADKEPDNPGLRPSEIKGLDFQPAAEILSERLSKISAELHNYDKPGWIGEFVKLCEAERDREQENWRRNWSTVASGKQIIDELYVEYEINMKKVEFKKLIVSKMAEGKTDNWRVIDQILTEELK